MLQQHCSKIKLSCCSVFKAFFCFLTIKYIFERWFPRDPHVQQQHVFARRTQKVNCRKKFKSIEFHKENSELWVTQAITRSRKTLKKEELVVGFDGKFSVEILEKAFHTLRASFLREHKKYQKEEKLPNKGWKFYESMPFLKNEPKNSEKFSIYGDTDKFCCLKIAAFFYCGWIKNASCGPWALEKVTFQRKNFSLADVQMPSHRFVAISTIKNES